MGSRQWGAQFKKEARLDCHASCTVDGSNLRLFLAVLLGMSLRCLFSVPSAVNHMGPRRMSMVCRLLVISGLVMLGRFPVVAGGVGEMF